MQARARASAQAKADAASKKREHDAYIARTTIRRGFRVNKSAGTGSRRKRGTGGGFIAPEQFTSTTGLTTKKKVLLGAL